MIFRKLLDCTYKPIRRLRPMYFSYTFNHKNYSHEFRFNPKFWTKIGFKRGYLDNIKCYSVGIPFLTYYLFVALLDQDCIK